MINFYEELEKFKPVLEAEEVEEAAEQDELSDVADILRTIAYRAG